MVLLRNIAIDAIEASPHNPRHSFDDETLQSLAKSISRLGVLQPILVQETQKDSDKYEIIAGERRWRASCLAKKKEIPALIVDIDEKALREVQLIENLEREQLNPIDEALAMKALQEYFGYTDVSLSRHLKRSLQFVRNRLDLLNLHTYIQTLLVEGKMTLTTAMELGRIEERDVQLQFAKDLEDKKVPVSEIATIVSRYKFEKRLQTQRTKKKQSFEKKKQLLAAQGSVITPETFDPEQHHRVWDLVFPSCATCTVKGHFLRSDEHVEAVCIQPECYHRQRVTYRQLRDESYEVQKQERLSSFQHVIETEEVNHEHLKYLLWTFLHLLGPAADKWRITNSLPSFAQATMAEVWDHLDTWSYESLLTHIFRLSVGCIASMHNNSIPYGMKQSLANNFGIPLRLLDESVL